MTKKLAEGSDVCRMRKGNCYLCKNSTDSTMNLDDKIDMYLKKLYEAKEHKMFAADLYRDDDDFHYMESVPNIIDSAMVERNLISVIKGLRMLTTNGIEVSQVGGWKEHKNRRTEHAKREMISQAEIQDLTKKQLELSIREMQVNFTQIRHWWLILIITTIGSALLGAWLQSLF